jgi:hypothetical protein
MQNHRPLEARQAANLVSPRTTWRITWSHEKPGKRQTWAPHGQHGYSLGPAMHHYRCKNVYILKTASKRIVDTLELFPHNYQMPQLLSTDWLLMAAKDMTDTLMIFIERDLIPKEDKGDYNHV